MNISFNEFQSLSEKGNIIPVYKEISGDIETPVSAFIKLNKSPSFLLESVVGGEKWARYSFLGFYPSIIIKSNHKKMEIHRDNKIDIIETDDPLVEIKKIMSKFKPVEMPGLPRFSGGFVGYLGYDIVKFYERVPDTAKPKIEMPDIFLMLADIILIFDNLKQTIKIVSNVYTDKRDIKSDYERAVDRINNVINDLMNPRSSINYMSELSQPEITFKFNSNFSKEDFLKAVSKAKEYIMSGDIVQVVLSQRFETEADCNPFDIYRSLRIINPSPYMYYIDIGNAQIVGSSPEILVRLEGDKITLRPIAGTRKRGKTEEDDKYLEEDLKRDPKEIAEHIMLVDLGRNDVGRVSEIGSVKVTELMTVERYSHVMHLVSNIEGTLQKGLDAFDLLRACFPAGTVTGAPKVRAMEIIEELEPTLRGTYGGAVGYFSYSGNMDTCITIRTLLIKDQKVYIQAGAGIVADSVPENEYNETVNKAMAMMKAIALGKSMKPIIQ